MDWPTAGIIITAIFTAGGTALKFIPAKKNGTNGYAKFLTREEIDTRFSALSAQVNSVENSMIKIDADMSNMGDRIKTLSENVNERISELSKGLNEYTKTILEMKGK